MAQSQVMTKQSTGGIETMPELKQVAAVRAAPGGHWVGDGFPVRTVFGYDNAEAVSPFLLLDYAGPLNFPPADKRRGVGRPAEHIGRGDVGEGTARIRIAQHHRRPLAKRHIASVQAKSKALPRPAFESQ